jgi:hypothetical protein
MSLFLFFFFSLLGYVDNLTEDDETSQLSHHERHEFAKTTLASEEDSDGGLTFVFLLFLFFFFRFFF